jgi:ApaG protein
MPRPTPLYYRITDGIRITARPLFLPDESDVSGGQFVFGYRIRIENTGAQGAQLLSRRWVIHDDAGSEKIVEGAGVVGQQPHLAPGGVHEYGSHCVLISPTGWMEGSYRFVADDGTTFDAAIPRFVLDAQSHGA